MNVLVKYKNLFLSFRQKVSLINIVGQVALIVTSILLANYIKEKYFDKRDRDEYLSLLYCDLQESLCDLRRDSTGHEIAFRNGQQMDQIISKMSKWDLSILNDSCKWDYLNSDFQF